MIGRQEHYVNRQSTANPTGPSFCGCPRPQRPVLTLGQYGALGRGIGFRLRRVYLTTLLVTLYKIVDDLEFDNWLLLDGIDNGLTLMSKRIVANAALMMRTAPPCHRAAPDSAGPASCPTRRY